MQNRKDEILRYSLVLFCENNFDNVTIRDIAEAAGVSAAEIYRYYDGKDAILEAGYQRYCDVLLANTPPPEEYIPVLEKGTTEDIARIFAFNMPEPHDVNVCAFKILMARRTSDKRAMDNYRRYAWEPSLSYVKEVMLKGVEIGRLDMRIEEIKTFAHHILAIREYVATIALVVSEQEAWRKMDMDMIAQVSALIQPYVVRQDNALNAADVPDILAETIRAESFAVGKYNYYSGILKRRGQTKLVALANEIVDNILDELNTLYGFSGFQGEQLSSAEIVKLIADNERLKRLEAEKGLELADDQLGEVFREIVELAQQHERICLNMPQQQEDMDYA